MTLQQAIANQRISVFDIETRPTGEVFVFTYRKPKESSQSMNARHKKNLEKANYLKKIK